MNPWNRNKRKRDNYSPAPVIIIGLSILAAMAITFLLAAQLILFPSKIRTSLTQETNIALQRNIEDQSGINTDMGAFGDTVLPSGDVNPTSDKRLNPERSPESTYKVPISTSSNSVVKNVKGPAPNLKKSDGKHATLVNKGIDAKLKTNAKQPSLKPAATFNSKLTNPDLENPRQEIKKPMMFSSDEINRVSVEAETKTMEEPSVKVDYIVKKNETVNTIAAKFGVIPGNIYHENGLTVSDEKLQEGRSITIPIPGNHQYRLKLKETLWRIAHRYGTTVVLIQEINNISDITKIKAGEIIILPVPVDKVVNKEL